MRHLDPRELDRAVLPQHPDETVETAKIEREQSLVIGELLLDIAGARRWRIDEVAVFREFPGDLLQGLRARGLQRSDLGLRGLQGFFLALGRRQRQQVVQGGNGCADLLFAVLRRAHQLGQFRLVGCRAGRRGLQRALHRLPAQHVRIAEGFFGDIAPEPSIGLSASTRKYPSITKRTRASRAAAVDPASSSLPPEAVSRYRDRFLECLQRFRRSSNCGPAPSPDSRVRPRY